MFKADGPVEEVEKWKGCLEQKASETSKDSKAKNEKAAAKQSSTITINSLWNRGQK